MPPLGLRVYLEDATKTGVADVSEKPERFLCVDRRLLYFEDSVLLVEENDLWRITFQLAVLAVVVAENDDPVSHYAFPCGGTVQTDFSGALLPWYRICLKPLPIVEIADHYLFIGKDVRLFEYGFVDGYAPLVGEVGLSDGCNMYLGSQNTA
jgi:hypothetical protein